MARGLPESERTRESGLLTSPKTMAPVGQDSMQAGTTSPSAKRSLVRPSRSPGRGIGTRCTQKEHFSMTPRLRTVTSGLFFIWMCPRVLRSAWRTDRGCSQVNSALVCRAE